MSIAGTGPANPAARVIGPAVSRRSFRIGHPTTTPHVSPRRPAEEVLIA
jgi:hypothetical protein